MSNLLLAIFLFTLSACILTYFFYPLSIWIIGHLFPVETVKKDILPEISILIAAYNEAKNIDRKILNTLSLDYPKDKVEILVGSDGSSDDTCKIVQRHAATGVRLFKFQSNRGKTAVQNDLVSASTGEILVFTDAASLLPPEAIRKIVRKFADAEIGCVAGKMRFVDTDQNLTTRSQGLYWQYEVKLRQWESKLGRLIGVDGPLYAVRRECYEPLEDHIISDLMTPLIVLAKGKKVVIDPDAMVDEDPTTKTHQEYTTRRRITLRGLAGLYSFKYMLNPLKYPFLSLQLFLHKILRWCVGVLLSINILACLGLLDHWFFKIWLCMVILFLIAAALGWIGERCGFSIKLLSIPYYFVLINAAATAGIIDFFRNKKAATWVPVRY
jgi:cellulose synthase/poly-beta-1,6-N-acetylglucosamine synthase-like glycosyltransferase